MNKDFFQRYKSQFSTIFVAKLLVLLIAVIQVVYTAHTFQVTRMEPLVISFTEVPFTNFFDLDVRNVKFRDYGPTFPIVLGWVQDLVGTQIQYLRYVPGFFLHSAFS